MAEPTSIPYWLIATPITSSYGPQDDWNGTRHNFARGAGPRPTLGRRPRARRASRR
jgi:hypothetical protein